MTDSALYDFWSRLGKLTTPEQLFGQLKGDTPAARLAEAKHLFRGFVFLVHEDRHVQEDRPTARAAFAKLTDLHREAIARINAGTYGTSTPKPSAPAIIKSRKATYTVTAGLAGGDLSNVYRATTGADDVVIKIAKSSGFNDLLVREAEVLKTLQDAAEDTQALKLFVPTCRESFLLNDRRANVLGFTPGWVSLAELVGYFPQGVDPRHFVWIFRRLLSVLAFAQTQRLVHGAVLPEHILIHPDNHALLLVDWCYSVPTGQRIVAISGSYRSWYPPEVLAKKPVDSTTDLFLAARCMIHILGGDPVAGVVPKDVPAPFARFLASTQLANPLRRAPIDWALHDAFSDVAKSVYGKPAFVPLVIHA